MLMLGILAGCKSEDPLTAKKAKLEELKKQQETVAFQIRELEKELTSLDPNALDEKKKGRLVTTLVAQKKAFQKFIDIQGNAESDLNVSISAEASGEVTSLPVMEGQKVTKGQLLLQIDDALIMRDIENNRVEFELAKTQFERQEKLWKQNIGSEMQYLQAKSRKEGLEAQTQKLQTMLDKVRIKAPVSGTVENIEVKIGETVAPGMPLLNVVNLDEIIVKADVPERYVGSVSKGEEVTISFPALDLQRKASVTSVGNIINPQNRTFSVEIKIPNKDNVLKANLLAVVKIIDYQNPDVITLPTRLIQHTSGDQFVFLVSNSNGEQTAKKSIVQTGASYGAETEVLSGITAGDIVINEGAHDISEGSLLDIRSNAAGE